MKRDFVLEGEDITYGEIKKKIAPTIGVRQDPDEYRWDAESVMYKPNMNGALHGSLVCAFLAFLTTFTGPLGFLVLGLPLFAVAAGFFAAVVTERDQPYGHSYLFPPKNTIDPHVAERRAIADAAIAAMRSGTFYSNGKEVVDEARRPFKGITHE